DIAACATGIDVFAQSATGGFTKHSYDGYSCGDDLVAADMTGDGRTDLVSNAIGTQVFAQAIDGTLAAPDTYSGLSEGYLTAGDLNADGRADVVAIAPHSSTFQQLRQLEQGHLAAAPEIDRALYW